MDMTSKASKIMSGNHVRTRMLASAYLRSACSGDQSFFPCADTVVAKGKSIAMIDLKRKTAPTSEPQVARNCQNFATFIP